MVSVVLILLILILAGSALLVLYGRSATRGSEGRLLSSLQTGFLNLQSSLLTMEAGEEVQVDLRLSAEEPLLSAWKGRAGTLRLVPAGGLYQKNITITNQKNYPLYNYPVRLWFTRRDNLDFSKVRPDGGDIRFYRGELPLRYYVENWNYPDNAVIWVEVPFLPASGTENIEMYYGVWSWESASDPSACWLIMEDMSSPPKGTLGGSAEYVGIGRYVRLTPNLDSRTGWLYYDGLDLGEGFLAEFELWAGLRTGVDRGRGKATWLYAYSDNSLPPIENSVTGGCHFAFDENVRQIAIFDNGTRIADNTRGDIDNLTWHSIRIEFWRRGAGENFSARVFYDNMHENAHVLRPDNIPSRFRRGRFFGWGARTTTSNNDHRIRNLRVRRYTFPEPSARAENRDVPVPWRPFLGPGLGSLEVGVRGWFTPATTFVLEGGAVLVEDGNGCRMLSPPPLISVSGENTLTVTYVLLRVPERSTVSFGTQKITLRCVNAGYREAPLGGPNRENVVVDLSFVAPERREVWRRYLAAENARLNSLGLNAGIDNLNPLRLTVLGRVPTAGVRDLHYYERVIEVEVL